MRTQNSEQPPKTSYNPEKSQITRRPLGTTTQKTKTESIDAERARKSNATPRSFGATTKSPVQQQKSGKRRTDERKNGEKFKITRHASPATTKNLKTPTNAGERRRLLGVVTVLAVSLSL